VPLVLSGGSHVRTDLASRVTRVARWCFVWYSDEKKI